MSLSIVDTHAHLDMPDFAGDVDEVVVRAVKAGVDRILTVGTDVAASEQSIQLAGKYPQVYAGVGIHPHAASGITKADIARLKELLKQPKVVALGEMGLDFYRMHSSPDAQYQTLQWQLELAIESELPVVIHARQASREMMQILGDWTRQRGSIPGKPPGMIHCFGNNNQSVAEELKNAQYYLGLGFYVAFGGYISYPKSIAPALIKELPVERLLLETDCPFLPPQQYRGKRNEPSYVTTALECMASAKGLSIEDTARQTTENAYTLFKFL